MSRAQDRHALAWVLLALTLLLGSVLGWSARVGWEHVRPVMERVMGTCVGAMEGALRVRTPGGHEHA